MTKKRPGRPKYQEEPVKYRLQILLTQQEKACLEILAEDKCTSMSDIARQALKAILEAQGI